MSRVGQIAEKESWRCRGDRQTARVRKAGDIEATGKPPERGKLAAKFPD